MLRIVAPVFQDMEHREFSVISWQHQMKKYLLGKKVSDRQETLPFRASCVRTDNNAILDIQVFTDPA